MSDTPNTNEGIVTAAAAVMADLQLEMMKAMRQQAEEIKCVGDAANKTKDTVSDTRKALRAMEAKVQDMEADARRIGVGDRPGSSPGDLIIASEAYKSYVAGSCRGVMQAVQLPSDSSFYHKTDPNTQLTGIGSYTGVTAGSLPAFLGGQTFIPQWFGQPARQPRIRDLFNVSPCTQAAVEFIMETGYLGSVGSQVHAATTPSSLPRLPAGNADKGELTYTQFSRPIQSISAYIPVTREAVADAPQLRSQINMQLMSALGDAEDYQLLYGDGTSPNLLGLTLTPNVQTYTAGVLDPTNDNMADDILNAIVQVNLAKFPCTGVIMHPLDWAKIKKMKTDDAMYIGPSMFNAGPSRIWEVPVIVTPAIAEHTFVCGATQMGATVWDRQQATIFLSDSHASNFIAQIVTVLADERLALTVTRPEAFVVGTWASS